MSSALMRSMRHMGPPTADRSVAGDLHGDVLSSEEHGIEPEGLVEASFLTHPEAHVLEAGTEGADPLRCLGESVAHGLHHGPGHRTSRPRDRGGGSSLERPRCTNQPGGVGDGTGGSGEAEHLPSSRRKVRNGADVTPADLRPSNVAAEHLV
jgi:hypothetical protein